MLTLHKFTMNTGFMISLAMLWIPYTLGERNDMTHLPWKVFSWMVDST